MPSTKSFLKILNRYLSNEKIDHSQRVANCAKELAIRYNLDQSILYNAGLLHDIAKGLNPRKCQDLKIDVTDLDDCWQNYPAVWHALVAPKIVEFEFKGTLSNLSSVIALHTTGNENMSKEEMALFIADFIEPGRDHPKRKEIDVFSTQSLELAVAHITFLSIDKLINKKVPIHPYTLNCWNFYCNYI